MNLRIWILATALLWTSTVLAAGSRTWTSKDGKATMEATFHKVDGDHVTVILANGRSQTFDKKFLSDADVQWIEQNSAGTASAPTAESGEASATSRIPAALKGKLIDDKGDPVDIAADGRAPGYYLFYYSASWCGPCKAFTPTLIKFYRKMKARDASFEVVLVPSDRSLEDEIAYLKDHRMPWPGLSFEEKNARNIPQSGWGYIPSMVLTDARGKTLLEVNDELTKEDFLDQAEEILGKGAATASN